MKKNERQRTRPGAHPEVAYRRLGLGLGDIAAALEEGPVRDGVVPWRDAIHANADRLQG